MRSMGPTCSIFEICTSAKLSLCLSANSANFSLQSSPGEAGWAYEPALVLLATGSKAVRVKGTTAEDIGGPTYTTVCTASLHSNIVASKIRGEGQWRDRIWNGSYPVLPPQCGRDDESNFRDLPSIPCTSVEHMLAEQQQLRGSVLATPHHYPKNVAKPCVLDSMPGTRSEDNGKLTKCTHLGKEGTPRKLAIVANTITSETVSQSP